MDNNKAPEITDDMVDRALAIWFPTQLTFRNDERSKTDMRAALAAALDYSSAKPTNEGSRS